jgi:hypothetical protein
VGAGGELDRLTLVAVAGQRPVVPAVEPHDLGQQVRIRAIGLRARGGVPFPVAGHRHRVDREHLIPRRDQGRDPRTTVGLDADLHQRLQLFGLELVHVLTQVLGNQRVQASDPVDALGQPPAGQQAALVVGQLDVVMVLGPVISDEQQPPLASCSTTSGSAARRRTTGDLMVKCSPSGGTTSQQWFSPPHDQQAHGLPRDLHGVRSVEC